MVMTLLLRQKSAGAEQALLVREERAHALGRLQQVVLSLATEERQFVELYYAGGASLAEMAERLAVSTRTLVRLHGRVRRKLARRLAELGVDSAPPDSTDAPAR